MVRSRLTLLVLGSLLAAACGSSTPSPDLGQREASPGGDLLGGDQARLSDGAREQARLDARREAGGTPKAKDCAATFGKALTSAFGRLDGTLLAVVTPTDTQCAQPNSDHLIVQVKVNGAAYRMVVNILSTVAGVDPRVLLDEVEAPLPSPAWSEGWHPGVTLDYVTTLAVHSDDFTPYEMNALVTRVSERLTLGAPISVYATSTGGTKADSAHLIHRNQAGKDGAIVVDPQGAKPSFLLFHFAEQTF